MPTVPIPHIPLALRSPGAIAVYALGTAAVGALIAYSLTRPEPDPDEVERERRGFLASSGRIVDGSITESQWNDEVATEAPHTLIYRYRIGGVTYECAQDVTPLTEQVRHVRIDLPIQVRFNPRNPWDSIVVAETWSGLRVAQTNLAKETSADGHTATPHL